MQNQIQAATPPQNSSNILVCQLQWWGIHPGRKASEHTLAAAVFQPPDGTAVSGPAAMAPACAPVTGGLTAVAGCSVGVAVVAAVANVEPMGALGVAGDVVGDAAAAVGVAPVVGAGAAWAQSVVSIRQTANTGHDLALAM